MDNNLFCIKKASQLTSYRLKHVKYCAFLLGCCTTKINKEIMRG